MSTAWQGLSKIDRDIGLVTLRKRVKALHEHAERENQFGKNGFGVELAREAKILQAVIDTLLVLDK